MKASATAFANALTLLATRLKESLAFIVLNHFRDCVSRSPIHTGHQLIPVSVQSKPNRPIFSKNETQRKVIFFLPQKIFINRNFLCYVVCMYNILDVGTKFTSPPSKITTMFISCLVAAYIYKPTIKCLTQRNFTCSGPRITVFIFAIKLNSQLTIREHNNIKVREP